MWTILPPLVSPTGVARWSSRFTSDWANWGTGSPRWRHLRLRLIRSSPISRLNILTCKSAWIWRRKKALVRNKESPHKRQTRVPHRTFCPRYSQWEKSWRANEWLRHQDIDLADTLARQSQSRPPFCSSGRAASATAGMSALQTRAIGFDRRWASESRWRERVDQRAWQVTVGCHVVHLTEWQEGLCLFFFFL